STLYQVLGLSRGASEQQLKAAFRVLARQFHPDVNAGDHSAEQRFKEVNDAYHTLADPGTRAAYDRALVCRQDQARRRFWSLARTARVPFARTAGVSLIAWWGHFAGAPKPPHSRAPDIDGAAEKLAQQRKFGSEGALSGEGAAAAAAVPDRRKGANWTTYRYQNARFSFALKYPADVFSFEAEPGKDEVRSFLSRDGGALLRIFAADNAPHTSLAKYRRSLIEGRYAGVNLDSTPQRKFWFALSGTRGDRVFYERVIFSCDNRSMHGWQMVYPSSER